MRTLGALAMALAWVFVLIASCSWDRTIPPEYEQQVRTAARGCPGLSARVLAAQIEQESKWDPEAVSRVGAQGLAQFMPQTWERWGVDADGDGERSAFVPDDAIASQGRLMCHLLGLARESDLPGRPIELALAGYNAGWGSVTEHAGIPPFPETESYVERIMRRAPSYRVRSDRS